MKAEFFYRNPLKKGEPKPAFGVKEPDPDRPDHKGFMKEVFNAREEDHSLSESGFILLNHKSKISNFYDDKEVPEKGARVVTSGYGGRISPGLIIGTVDVNRQGQTRVKLREKISNMNYVRVLDYKFVEAPEEETELPEALKIAPQNSEGQQINNKIEGP